MLPYLQRVWETKGLRKTKKWTLISDVFEVQWRDSVKQPVTDNYGKIVSVPNDMALSSMQYSTDEYA